MNKIVRVKKGFDFQKELQKSRKHLAYYEEGLRVETAARILDAMENRSVSRSELARRLEVSPAYITKILRGNANLSLESLAKLAFALDLKWEMILMPKNASISLLSWTDESGKAAVCSVEKATVVTVGKAVDADEDAYAEGIQTEEVYHEMRIPA